VAQQQAVKDAEPLSIIVSRHLSRRGIFCDLAKALHES
jgi:hypothetical protein